MEKGNPITAGIPKREGRWMAMGGALLACFAALASYCQSTISSQTTGQNAAPDPRLQEYEKPGVRFDMLVRDDFFAGMMGNRERLERGMRFCEQVLAQHPHHAEALVWHGGGLLGEASFSYKSGDFKLGDEQFQRGLEEMNEARRYEPDNLGVMIGRAAELIGISQSGFDPSDAPSRELLASAVADYEIVLARQEKVFDQLSLHSRGELLFGLASGWSMLGNEPKTRAYLQRIVRDCKGSGYDTEARGWLGKSPLAKVDHQCFGCHVN